MPANLNILKALFLDEVVAGHLLGLGKAHDVEDGGGDVGKDTVLGVSALFLGDVYKGHGVERVSGVWCAVGVDCIVGVAVVGNDDYLVVVHRLGGLDNIVEACIEGLDSLLNGGIDTGVAYHVTVGKVDDDEVVFVGLDGVDKLVLDLDSAHLGLQIVCSDLGRRHECAVLAGEGSLAAAVEEECDVGILLGFGDMELLLVHRREVFGEGVADVFLVEEDVDALER